MNKRNAYALGQHARAEPGGAVKRVFVSGAGDEWLIDSSRAAALGSASVSWWRDQVRQGRAPAPALRLPRFTRWRLGDVRNFWLDLVEQSSAHVAAQVVDHAKRASRKASEKRPTESDSPDPVASTVVLDSEVST